LLRACPRHGAPLALRPPADDVAECDIVDLITDLLLLARLRGHDPATIVSKAERHVYAETGHQYGP
jgi:hypothetical protein